MIKNKSAFNGFLIMCCIWFLIPGIGIMLTSISPVLIIIVLGGLLYSKLGHDSFKGCKDPKKAKILTTVFLVFLAFVFMRFGGPARIALVIFFILMIFYNVGLSMQNKNN